MSRIAVDDVQRYVWAQTGLRYSRLLICEVCVSWLLKCLRIMDIRMCAHPKGESRWMGGWTDR